MILNTRGNPDFEHETEIQELNMDKPQPVEAQSPLYSITWDPYLSYEFTCPEACPKNFILKAPHSPHLHNIIITKIAGTTLEVIIINFILTFAAVTHIHAFQSMRKAITAF